MEGKLYLKDLKKILMDGVIIRKRMQKMQPETQEEQVQNWQACGESIPENERYIPDMGLLYLV